MATMDTLETYRDALAALAGVVSCKIGIEANLGPADYPMIRLVPSRLTPGKPYSGRTIETLIYFGAQNTLSEGLETVYAGLFDIEALILSEIRSLGGRYIETITDEDRLDAYKLMTIRAELGEPQGWSKCVMSCATFDGIGGGVAVVLAPFTTIALNSDADDWTPTLIDGSISRLLNGAASTLTRITVTGRASGAIASEIRIVISQGGSRISNCVSFITTGAANFIPFEVSVVAAATGTAVFDVRATVTSGAYAFADVTLTAERTTSRAS